MQTKASQRPRRTPEQRIAELQSRIAALKQGADAQAGGSVTPERLAPPAARKPPGIRNEVPESLESQIAASIQTFTDDLLELIKRATLEEVNRALGGSDWPSSGAQHGGRVSQRGRTALPYVLVPVGRGGTDSKRTDSPHLDAPRGSGILFERYERMAIRRAVSEAGQDVKRAAALLGMSKSGIYRWMQRLGIPYPTPSSPIGCNQYDPVLLAGEPLSLPAYERAAILDALGQCKGDLWAAARLLECSKSAIYRRMSATGIPRTWARMHRPMVGAGRSAEA